MYATVDQKELSRAIIAAKRTLAKSAQLDHLKRIIVRAAGPDTLEICSTSIDTGTIVRIKAAVAPMHDGDTCDDFAVDPKAFGAIAKKLPKGSIQLRCESGCGDEPGTLYLESGSVTLACETETALALPDLPEVGDFEGEPICEVQPADFRSIVESVLVAASRDFTRYNLNGVYWEPNGFDGSEWVATDGHRVAHVELAKVPASYHEGQSQQGLILPFELVDAIGKALGKNGRTPVSLYRLGKQVAGRIGETWIFGNVVEGNFPNWRQVCPKVGSTVSLPRERLIQACRNLEGANRSNSIKLTFGFDGLVIENAASSVARIDCRHPFGEDKGFSIGFNARYLREAVEGFDSPDVQMGFADTGDGDASLSPVRLQNGDEHSRFAVVMPMRT